MGSAMASGAAPPDHAAPPAAQYLKARVYTAEEDARVLKLYDGLRVCDVIDALDAVGLQAVTTMDRSIRPMWRDEQKFAHRIHGIALTLRLVPAQETSPKFASHAAERTWEAGGWGPPPETAGGGRAAGWLWRLDPAGYHPGDRQPGHRQRRLRLQQLAGHDGPRGARAWSATQSAATTTK